jgi:hypothetical protein
VVTAVSTLWQFVAFERLVVITTEDVTAETEAGEAGYLPAPFFDGTLVRMLLALLY